MLIATVAQAFPNPSSNVIQEYSQDKILPVFGLCARLYEHRNFEGKYENLVEGEFGWLNLDNQVSSFKLRSGCCLFGYKQNGFPGRLDFLFLATRRTKPALSKIHDDAISGVSCRCSKKCMIIP